MAVNTASTWTRPDPNDFLQQTDTYDIGGDCFAKVRTAWDGAQMMDFAVMQLLRDPTAGQEEIARADSCHDAHVHKFKRNIGEFMYITLLAINCPNDVGRGYDLGYNSVIDQWEENLRMWRDG